ncbi:hypothetical protein GGR55DRAFT_700820 [Xylaria sp. FL0064]|nr:hypothetical protein GGR55DRAFT_700820 [Xylaria sp. FL0064]
MSTTSAHPVEEAGLPSYEELRRARQWIRFPAGLDRFVWHLDGPLPSSIWVRETDDKKAPMEPYWQQTESDDEELPEGIKFGPIPNYNSETDRWPSQSDKRPWHLLECCGTKRPRGKNETIVVKPSPKNGLVTIHNYFSTVHPWLMGLRDVILDAMGVMDAKSLPPETKLRVEFMSLGNLKIEDRKPQRTITEPYIT